MVDFCGQKGPATARENGGVPLQGRSSAISRELLLEDGVAATAAAGFLEVGAFFEFALLAGVEGLNGAVVTHYAGVNSALGALGFVLGKNLLIGLNNRLYFLIHGI